MHLFDECVVVPVLMLLLLGLFLSVKFRDIRLLILLPQMSDFLGSCPCFVDFFHDSLLLFHEQIDSVLDFLLVVFETF